MHARAAAFEDGDPGKLRAMTEERVKSDDARLPEGLSRVMLLEGERRRLFITLFQDEAAMRAAEQRFEELGDEIKEDVRGKRVSVDFYEVAIDEEVGESSRLIHPQQKERIRASLRGLMRAMADAGLSLDCANLTTMDMACCRAVNDMIADEGGGSGDNNASDEVMFACMDIA
jgi:hypothetical protein